MKAGFLNRRSDIQAREQAEWLDQAADAVIVHDLNWRAQYWNASAADLYGWSFEEVRKMNLKTEVFKADPPALLEALQSTLEKGEWSGDLRQATKAGPQLIVQSRWTLLRDDAGKPKAILVFNSDVTARKKLEAQFMRAQRLESLGTLAGGIAHDLNNALAPIVMGVELMKLKPVDESTQRMLDTIGSGTQRASEMLKQVLTFARGHGGEHRVLHIGHLLEDMRKIVLTTLPESIKFDIRAGDLSPVLGDAAQIRQLLFNLCVNARDAMPDGGRILLEAREVTLSEAGARRIFGARPISYVLLSVTDAGTGISPENLDRIFEPFFTTKEVGSGTGLGLSTVASIVKGHGGVVDVRSEPGQGATFNVYLPALVPEAARPERTVSRQELQGRGETVMVVEDEPAILELTKTILEHHGYQVITAIHGADALAAHARHQDKIKVVLMDMMMPVMDGPAAIRALRERQPGLQFIAISGLMQSGRLKEELGGVEIPFLAKPCATEKFLLTLRQLIVAADAVASPVPA